MTDPKAQADSSAHRPERALAEVKCEYNTPGCQIEQGIIHTRGCKPSQPDAVVSCDCTPSKRWIDCPTHGDDAQAKAVEAKIKEIVDGVHSNTNYEKVIFEGILRELVKLAREGK